MDLKDGTPRVRRLTRADAEQLAGFLIDQSGEIQISYPGDINAATVERFLGGKLAGLIDAFAIWDTRGKLLGTAWLQNMESDEPGIQLYTLQKTDIAEQLLQRVVDEARGQQKRILKVIPTKHQQSGFCRRLYESKGFVADDNGSMELELGAGKEEMLSSIRRRLSGKRLMIIPYTHPDWAWTHTRNWHERRYTLVFEEVLGLMREHPEFRWYMDNYTCQLRPLLNYRPDLLDELRQRIHEGKIAVCGGYSNLRPNMVGGETFIRNQIIGRMKWRQFFPQADLSVHADAVDVAVGHPQMPQLLKLSGYQYLRMWRPFPAVSQKGIPTDFVWQGCDGSKIQVSRGAYGGLVWMDEKEAFASMEDHWGKLLLDLWRREIEEKDHYGYDQLWLAHGMDDGRPLRLMDDTPVDLFAFVEQWNRNENSSMEWATPVEYFASVDKTELPLITGTLDPCDVSYNAAWNGEKGLGTRRVRNDRLLVETEIWSSLASSYGFQYPEEQLNELWCHHLTTCAHATQWLFTSDFDEIKRWADEVEAEATQLREKALDTLVKNMDLPDNTVEVVFNQMPFERTAVVSILASGYGGQPGFTLTDMDSNILPQQVVKEYGGQGGFREYEILTEVELPPMGYAAVCATTGNPRRNRENGDTSSSGRPATFMNGVLKVSLTKNGITSVTCGDHHYETDAWGQPVFCEVDVNAGLLHVGPITNQVYPQWKSAEVLEEGPVRWAYRQSGFIDDIPVEMRTVLYRNEPRIDQHLIVDWPGKDGFLAARLKLPFRPNLVGNVPFAVEDKDLTAEHYGSFERGRQGLFYAKDFVACEGAKQGIALITRDGHHFFIYDDEANHLDHILLNSINHSHGWEENVNKSSFTGKGRHEFHYSTLFYEGDWKDADLPRQADQLIHPAFGRKPYQGDSAKPLMPKGSWLSIDPDNVYLSAFYRQGDRYILRLYESHGMAANVKVRLPWEPLEVHCVDFEGNSMATPVSANGHELQLELGEWQICTLSLIPAPAR